MSNFAKTINGYAGYFITRGCAAGTGMEVETGNGLRIT